MSSLIYVINNDAWRQWRTAPSPRERYIPTKAEWSASVFLNGQKTSHGVVANLNFYLCVCAESGWFTLDWESHIFQKGYPAFSERLKISAHGRQGVNNAQTCSQSLFYEVSFFCTLLFLIIYKFLHFSTWRNCAWWPRVHRSGVRSRWVWIDAALKFQREPSFYGFLLVVHVCGGTYT